ncbi:MAG: response regulator [Lysobacter sp.]|nr:response regulator [Lysobacter sp.]
MSLRIALSDDHPVVRAGVRALLETASGLNEDWKVVAEAANADELLNLLAETPLNLLITDFSMPGSRAGDGLTLIGMIRRRYPNLPVIVLTMISNVPVLRAIADAGVRGLLDKAAAATELPNVVRSVMQGREYYGEALRGALESNGEREEHLALSPRETEVLRLFVAGNSVSEIAAKLHRSKQTISRQKTDAMNKLGLKNDLEIYDYARSMGLVS